MLGLNFTNGTAPSAQQFIHGLLEAFQPDVLVETKPGLSKLVNFEKSRVISLQQFDEEQNGQRQYAVDLRSVCAALYAEEFQFIRRHPPKVVEPLPTEKKYGLLFAAVFGEFPRTGTLAECQRNFQQKLDAKQQSIGADALHELLDSDSLYPLRVGAYQLTAVRQGRRPDPMLFYMDESEPYDIIEYWNLRALGWRITPLPHLIAHRLKKYCEKFIRDAHRPYPPPSNASEDASFLCSRSCAFDEMQALVSTFERPNTHCVSADPRVPRLWEESGRHADEAKPQLIEHETEQVDVFSLGDSIAIGTVMPDFVRECAPTPYACTNVIESLPGGASVIPWQMIDVEGIAGQMHDEGIWVGREGICTTSGPYPTTRTLRLPNSLTVFAAWAKKSGLEIELSPAGRLADQLIGALGGIAGIPIIGSEELIKVLDRMANGTLEVEIREQDESESPKRRLRKRSIPLNHLQQLLNGVNNKNLKVAENHLSSLLTNKVLVLGLEVPCAHCENKNWFSLDQLGNKLKCERCLREFGFPVIAPHKNTWSYKVQGPFAVENYAGGGYCVATAIHFMVGKISRECTWIPSFELRRTNATPIMAEADFAAFVRPVGFSSLTNPMLIFGECKTYGEFESRDYERMTMLAKLFPGAVICFCTLRATLTSREKTKIAKIARHGRKRLKTGRRRNPVLVLTGIELLGHFKTGKFPNQYPAEFVRLGERTFLRRDLHEICDFTQQVHLGIESYDEWFQRHRKSRRVNRGATVAFTVAGPT